MNNHFVLKSDRIVLTQGIRSGFLEIKGTKVVAFHDSLPKEHEDNCIDYTGKTVMPGFLDIHVHGCGRGSYAYKGTQHSLKMMSEDLAKSGVTSYLATSGTMPNDFLESSLKEAADFIESATPEMGSEAVGIHMEGPYINEKYLGMQRADSLQKPSVEGFERFNDIARGHIKLMTLAPEVEGSIELIRHLKSIGVTSSAGHTAATFDEIAKAVEAGLDHFTHAYSGMRGFHHRELGVVGALMYFEDVYAEVAKQTGITIKPEAFDILYRLKKDRRLVMMSDCMGYADFPEGYEFHHYLRQETFRIKDQKLEIENKEGETRIINPCCFDEVKDLEMNFLESVRNVVDRLENGLHSVAKIACENPAHLAGVVDRKGSLCAGKDADIIVLDDTLVLVDVYCRGIKQPLAA